MKKILFLLIALTLLNGYASDYLPLKTVSHVNLHEYMGRWYEIASLPSFFQKDCQCTSANYKLLNNKVRIINSCYKAKDNKISRATGKAWPVKGSNNSKLKIQFFWPFTGNYWILYLSHGYKNVIVGSPSRKYLWILSRKTQINHSDYIKLVKIAKHKDFDVSKLIKTKQSCHNKKRGADINIS